MPSVRQLHLTSMVTKRVRKSPEERMREIEQATARLVAERGYNGISLKDVAEEVGMSQPGLLHYVGNKEGLLSLLITDMYDAHGTPAEFMASGLPGSDPEAPLFPAYLRFLVRHNAAQRQMVQLFLMLYIESVNPDHPLHDYYRNRPENIWEHYSRYPWRIPPQVGQWDPGMRPYVRRVIEAMDGVQMRWLCLPPVDLYDEWLVFERMIFPSPIWDGYR
ncbi:TetR-type transcriptional regulator [Bifidobacterium cuniculi]|uniref:TetR-type transcriptional regulator n=2 Tax=Bifidobacterium cuniculi TaxID=1688 RepID=A0A087AYM4_9BIFI|nr:TetR-type transcriptional regulator [Bifidobacterium cuniculi]